MHQERTFDSQTGLLGECSTFLKNLESNVNIVENPTVGTLPYQNVQGVNFCCEKDFLQKCSTFFKMCGPGVKGHH